MHMKMYTICHQYKGEMTKNTIETIQQENIMNIILSNNYSLVQLGEFLYCFNYWRIYKKILLANDTTNINEGV